MILDLTQFMFSLVYRGIKESHKEDKVDVAVGLKDEVPSSIKSAIKKEYGAKFLDDADILIFFKEKTEAEAQPQEENGQEEQPQEEKPTEEQPAEQTSENPEGGESEPISEGSKKEDNVETEEEITLKNDMAKIVDRVFYNTDDQNVQMNSLLFDGKKYFFTKVASKRG